MMFRRLLGLVIAVAGLLAAVPIADAALFCVNKPPCTGGTEVATFKGAIDAANAATTDPVDTIEIGSGTYPFAASAVANSGQGLRVVGAGRGATTLQGAAGGDVLDAHDPDTVVSDLTIALPAVDGADGVDLSGGRVERVDVIGDAGTSSNAVILRDGADATDVRALIDPNPAGANDAFSVNPDPADPTVLENVEGQAMYVASASSGPGLMVVRRARLTGRFPIAGRAMSQIDADGVLARIVGQGSGVYFSQGGGAVTDDTVADLRHVTFVSDGDPDAKVVELVNSTSSPHETRVVARDVLVSGVARAGEMFTGGSAHAEYNLAYSTARHEPIQTTGPVGSFEIVDGPGLIPPPADPGFVGGGDFALKSSSPYVDMGEPGGLSGAQSPVDLLGAPRVADGNGDGATRRDVGAFEYQPPPPPATPISSTPPAGTPQPPVALPPVIARRAPLLRLLFASALRLDRRGRLILPVSCPRGGPVCVGRVQVATASAIAAQRRRRQRRRIVSFGSVSYRVAAGRTARLIIRVSRRNRSLVRRRRAIRMVARATASDGGASRKPFTLRPARRARRR
jgi:hypothetical protein